MLTSRLQEAQHPRLLRVVNDRKIRRYQEIIEALLLLQAGFDPNAAGSGIMLPPDSLGLKVATTWLKPSGLTSETCGLGNVQAQLLTLLINQQATFADGTVAVTNMSAKRTR